MHLSWDAVLLMLSGESQVFQSAEKRYDPEIRGLIYPEGFEGVFRVLQYRDDQVQLSPVLERRKGKPQRYKPVQDAMVTRQFWYKAVDEAKLQMLRRQCRLEQSMPFRLGELQGSRTGNDESSCTTGRPLGYLAKELQRR